MINKGFNINYKVYGDADNTLIFSHGNGNCIKDWLTLGYVDKLAPHFRLVLMDALGYGESDKPLDAKQYTPERRAEDVIAVLDDLDIGQANFFGSSMGGSLGFVLADLYQERFLSFIIGSAHPYGSSQPVGCNLFGEEFRELLAMRGMRGFVKEMEEKYLGRRFHEGVRAQYLKNNPQAMIAANTPEWPDRSHCLRNITVPVLLFAGDQDPVSEYQATIAKQIPHSQVSILADTDHADSYWNSAKIAPLIKKFITEGPMANLQ